MYPSNGQEGAHHAEFEVSTAKREKGTVLLGFGMSDRVESFTRVFKWFYV